VLRRLLPPAVVVLAALVAWPAGAAGAEVGVATAVTGNGRQLDPAGRLVELGRFPIGGALTPDGRAYWAVDAGRGANSIRIVDVATAKVVQTLPLPGGYVGVAFAPDGRRAYVSGLKAEGDTPEGLPGADGDVIHVFDVDPRTLRATEVQPLVLPDARDGQAARDQLPPATGVAAWPEGLAVTADGRRLVVALGQADQVAIFDLESGRAQLADVGRYPYGVALDPRRPRAYVTNERDGTVTVLELPSGRRLATIGVGGPRGDAYAHPQGLAVDPVRDRLYVAVTDRDLVAVIDTASLRLERLVDVGRAEGIGVVPVTVAVAPDARTLYVADAGEDAVAVVALEDRAARAERERRVRRARSVASIVRYRRSARGARGARLRGLQRRLLLGAPVRACRGPSTAQDRRYARAVLRALEVRTRALRRARTASRRRAARRAFERTTGRARRALPDVVRCAQRGDAPGVRAFSVLGRIPTAAYTTDVEVTPDGRRLVWLAAKGLGTGPNTGPVSNIDRLLFGRAGVLETPTDVEAQRLRARADRAVVPSNVVPAPPPNTPLIGPGGGPSDKIKHVFYVVRENRTYDQILGSEPRGQGDPRLQVFDDNGVPGPTGGVTPNVHALVRRFPLLDRVFANSEESTVGHQITAGGYVNDYTMRKATTGRGKRGDPDIFAIGIPPNGYVFDQAARQGVTFRNYGEAAVHAIPGFGNDEGRPTFGAVANGTDQAYPSQVFGSCSPLGGAADPALERVPNAVRCTADAGQVGATSGPPAVNSRMRSFAAQFTAQVATGTVPALNYVVLFNDHTDGSAPGAYTPKAMVADNDLALGQLVELVSNSPIWDSSAIFVVEDDSQSGIDSIDAHRIPALVISPWARRGAVVSTRYDQLSFLRTVDMVLGLRPLSLGEALATPLYDAFVSGDEQPDVEGTRFRAIQPEQSLTEVNPPGAANRRLTRALPWEEPDQVPQELADRIIWQSVFGAGAAVPPPGPNASPIERGRARGALDLMREGRSAAIRPFLAATAEDEEGEEGEEDDD
jgi:DNA-binding beta-propeller fold protein YncE